MPRSILVIGESLIDIVQPLAGEVREHAGGSPANVAITLSRLGNEAHLLTWFGEDSHGDLISEHLEESGVHVVGGSRGASHTSTALARLDATGAATYTFDIEWRVPEFELTQPVAAVHIGSIAAILEPGGSAALEVIRERQPDSILTYDPNMRPDLMGSPDAVRSRVEELVGLSDIVKVSDEDLEWLYPGEGLAEIARRWQAGQPSNTLPSSTQRGPAQPRATQYGARPALVIVTRGGSGAFAVSAGGVVEVDAPRVEVADTVGAGDSFMGAVIDHVGASGLLSAQRRPELHRLGEAEIAALLTYASKVAAITVSRPGANPPWRRELG